MTAIVAYFQGSEHRMAVPQLNPIPYMHCWNKCSGGIKSFMAVTNATALVIMA